MELGPTANIQHLNICMSTLHCQVTWWLYSEKKKYPQDPPELNIPKTLQNRLSGELLNFQNCLKLMSPKHQQRKNFLAMPPLLLPPYLQSVINNCPGNLLPGGDGHLRERHRTNRGAAHHPPRLQDDKQDQRTG